MSSKFSVFSKFYKYLNLKKYSFRPIFAGKCPMISRRCYSNNLIAGQRNNMIFTNDFAKFGITRNMSSGHNNKDETHKNMKRNNKKLIMKYKKKILRKRSKIKSIKSFDKKFHQPWIKQRDTKDTIQKLMITEILPTTNITQEDKTNKQIKLPGPNKDQDILQTHLSSNKVHVEFMESQNRIDFNPPSQPLNTKNIKQSIIDIKIAPIVPINEHFNLDSIKKDIKTLESKQLTKSYRNNDNKSILKTDENDTKETSIEKSIPKIPLKKDSGNTVKLIEKASKKGDNIRVLYQGNRKRKTKIRIPKIKKLKRSQDEAKNLKNSLNVEETNNSTVGKGSLFPTKYDEKIESKNFKYNMIESFTKQRKGILYPTIMSAPLKMKTEAKPLPNIDTDSLQIPMMKFECKPDIFKENYKNPKLLLNNTKTKNKLRTNRRNLQKPQNTSISKNIKPFYTSNKDNLFLKTSTDKLKNNINIQSSQQLSSPSKKSIPNKDGTGIVKINKFTKYKRSKRGNDQNSKGGENNNSNSKSTTKAPPSAIWRNISYTILPLIFGLTIYTLCNIEAVEMFKRMRDPTLIKNPIAMNMLRTFYGKKSKPKSMDLKDADKENLNVNNLQENTFEDQN